MLNKNGGVLFWGKRKCFQVFTTKDDASCSFFIYDLYYVEVCSLYAPFLQSFKEKYLLNFVKSFFCIYQDDYTDLILQFVDVIYHIDWFVDVEESLHSWDESHLIIMYYLLMYFWIWIASILFRIFASMFISNTACSFIFFVIYLSEFGIRVMVASLNEFGSLPSSKYFWNNFTRIGVNSSLNVW